jgi:hypothetical protein
MIIGTATVDMNGQISYSPEETEVVQIERELFEELVSYAVALKKIKELLGW